MFEKGVHISIKKKGWGGGCSRNEKFQFTVTRVLSTDFTDFFFLMGQNKLETLLLNGKAGFFFLIYNNVC